MHSEHTRGKDLDTRNALMRLIPLLTLEGQLIREAVCERYGLHETDVQALSCIMVAEAQEAPVTAGALCSELRLSSGAVTFLMGRLGRAGLIEKARDEDDHRKVLIRLTAEGRDIASTIYPPILELSNAVMDRFTPAELATVQRFLAAVTTAMATYRTSITSTPS